MKKKVIGIIAAIVIVLGLILVVYNQIIPNEYVPADDEITQYVLWQLGIPLFKR